MLISWALWQPYPTLDVSCPPPVQPSFCEVQKKLHIGLLRPFVQLGCFSAHVLAHPECWCSCSVNWFTAQFHSCFSAGFFGFMLQTRTVCFDGCEFTALHVWSDVPWRQGYSFTTYIPFAGDVAGAPRCCSLSCHLLPHVWLSRCAGHYTGPGIEVVPLLVSSQGVCKHCLCQNNRRRCFRHFQCFLLFFWQGGKQIPRG